MSGADSDRSDKRQKLKELLRKLHEGTTPAELKEEFRRILGAIPPSEIAQIEQELVEAGIPREEIRSLCDVHLEVMRESLEAETIATPPWHPISTLMEEHNMQVKYAEILRNAVKRLEGLTDMSAAGRLVEHIVRNADLLARSESHYVREENVLFPYLEKHGITEPPAVMWMDHDAIRETKKNLVGMLDEAGESSPAGRASALAELAVALSEQLASHFFKENRILFPTALRVIQPAEWLEVRKQCDELGYCPYTPKPPQAPKEKTAMEHAPGEAGSLSFESGSMSSDEIESVLNTLPVDVTFVGKDDTVRYFSMGKERIFPRTPAIIGRQVQQCHPQKSVHVVTQILEDFKAGRRDVAEFWINLEGKFVYIRYFPVRNKAGEYLGCLEVTQDIAPLREIEGERRLLD
jgi:DUF438 domain-containing protein